MKDRRLTLRALEPEDVELLYALENDTDLWPVGDSNAPYSRATLRQYIAANTNDIYADRQLRLVIAADGLAVGCADLFHFNPQNSRAEVGIALLPEWRGQGLGSEALRQLSHFAKEHLALHQLYAIVSVANAKAMRLFAACGFEQTASLRSWIVRGPEVQDAAVFQLFL